MNELTQRAHRYLNQLAPHQRDREGAKIIEELLSTINAGGQETSGGNAAEARNSRIGSNPVTPAPDTATQRPIVSSKSQLKRLTAQGVVPQFALGEQCKHGHLARQCEICDLERERDEAYNAGIEAMAKWCHDQGNEALLSIVLNKWRGLLRKGGA